MELSLSTGWVYLAFLIPAFLTTVGLLIVAIKRVRSGRMPNYIFWPILFVIVSLLLALAGIIVDAALAMQHLPSIFEALHLPREQMDQLFKSNLGYFVFSIILHAVIRPLWWYLCIVATCAWIKLCLRLPHKNFYNKTTIDYILAAVSVLLPIIVLITNKSNWMTLTLSTRIICVMGTGILALVGLTQATKVTDETIKRLLNLIGLWSLASFGFYAFELLYIHAHNNALLPYTINYVPACLDIAAQLALIGYLLFGVFGTTKNN